MPDGGKISRRGNSMRRCEQCRLHADLCVCALLPRLTTRTRLLLVLHRYEARKTTNTGQLAAACLGGSRVVLRGHMEAPDEAIGWEAGTQPLLLFPHEDARPIEDFVAGAPVTLIVPDGTWRQAAKMRRRVPGLGEVPCVKLPPGEPSRYRLREEPHEHGLSTIEAIARALGRLEGEAVQRALEEAFALMTERSLWARGTIATDDVTGGIPEAARLRARG